MSSQADCEAALAVQPLACARTQGQDIVQAFSETMLDIPDADLSDAGNVHLCSDYVKDIYSYLRRLEVTKWLMAYLFWYFECA